MRACKIEASHLLAATGPRNLRGRTNGRRESSRWPCRTAQLHRYPRHFLLCRTRPVARVALTNNIAFQMKTHPLGTSSLRPTRIAYGAWRLISTMDPKEVTPERGAEGRRAVVAAYEAGYTLFDHADIYCR